jgi:beta-lactamase regulating signal transducer with metallopeptidase domain
VTAHWMLYCLAVGALLTLGALAMELAMRAFGLPQRWIWAAALVLGLAIPTAARWMPRPAAPAPAAESDAVEGTRMRLADVPAAAAEDLRRFDAAALDGPLAAGWMALSAIAVLALLGAAIVLEVRRRRWRAAEVEGVPVLVAPDTGPAVVGLFRSRIVLPEWVVRDAEPGVRALLMEHEREHLRAGDPRLLALGLAAVALAPWNPAAWYGLRRLRLAIEVDCDARVLARRADVRAYGTLLLEVGRRGTGGRLAAAAFSEPVSFLERRIRIMTSPRARFPWLRASGFGAVALALVAVACRAPGPVPSSPSASGTRAEPARTEITTTTEARSGVRIARADIDAAIRAHYPEVFSAAPTDTASLLFVIGEDGEVQRHERLRRRRPGPTPAVAPADELRTRARTPMGGANPAGAIADHVTFSPGQMGPGRVEVMWMRMVSGDELTTVVEVDPVPVRAGETVLTTTVGTARVAGQPAQATTVQTARVAGQPAQATTVQTARVPGRPAQATVVGTARVAGQPAQATTVQTARVPGQPAQATTTVGTARVSGQPAQATTVTPDEKP